MEKTNGVYKLNCKVNGVPMNFIFDTGASNVSISKTEALFLIKQGLITKEDIIGNINYQVANGEIHEGTKINLKTFEIEGLTINNVTATVVHTQNSPLLLGQSLLSKLGKFSIDGDNLIIESTKSENEFKKNILEGYDFLNEYLSIHTINNNETKLKNYFFELRPVKQSGFAIMGRTETTLDKQTKSVPFIIFLDNVKEVYFNETEESDSIENLVFTAQKNSDGFILLKGEKFFKTYKLSLKICCTNLKSRIRALNAVEHMLKYNKKYIEKNVKF
tara:strand:+ start:10379 stop:11203 length:825 start_codon:yes stop_codon:yes gene_type:complete